jgi:mannose/cellobiose epimerase-like protein (N-acyl-D-glucosamine 2-epimerase family)
MQIGDLVQSKRFENKIGFIVEIFGDLDEKDPWLRVRWTAPLHAFEWCKQNGLTVLGKNTITKK